MRSNNVSHLSAIAVAVQEAVVMAAARVPAQAILLRIMSLKMLAMRAVA